MKSSDNVTEDYASYLTDESGLVSNGQADHIYFPVSEDEVQDLMQEAYQREISVTVSGGGTGISGGRVPLAGWILATDDMTILQSTQKPHVWKDRVSGKQFQYELRQQTENLAYLTIPVAMTVKMIQDLCRELGWFYPPDPTERSSFIGGNVITNASGARSFKYGATREWIQSMRVVLPQGDLVILSRDDEPLESSDSITLDPNLPSIPRPNYSLPSTSKNVAGPVITDKSQPMDMIIGSDGIFGIVTEVTLKLIRPPAEIVSIFAYLENTEQAIELAKVAQTNRQRNRDPVPMSVEYLDDRATAIIKQQEPTVPDTCIAIVILEQDASSVDQLFEFLQYWTEIFETLGIDHTSVAQTHAEIEHYKKLRHSVPETINEMARSNNQPKLGTDYAAPLDKMEDMIELARGLGNRFEEQVNPDGSYAYAIWAHFGDNHFHLNFLPQSDDQRKLAKQMMVEFMEQVVTWNGSIAAEHGLGKKYFNGQPALELQLGMKGLQQIFEMKQVLDPQFLLNPGNLIGSDLSRYQT